MLDFEKSYVRGGDDNSRVEMEEKRARGAKEAAEKAELLRRERAEDRKRAPMELKRAEKDKEKAEGELEKLREELGRIEAGVRSRLDKQPVVRAEPIKGQFGNLSVKVLEDRLKKHQEEIQASDATFIGRVRNRVAPSETMKRLRAEMQEMQMVLDAKWKVRSSESERSSIQSKAEIQGSVIRQKIREALADVEQAKQRIEKWKSLK